ncbi:uridine kinase family protein [Candidatus Poriferisocius sp.]|uniref:uridine kinase family protein n=1 Tax=Candidatus Poriferisocius sp. TaxID=3101276 RepID=UPI003B5A8D66
MTADIARIVAELGAAPRIGIDGPGASGKSTLAVGLAEALPKAVLVEGDDFYGPESNTKRSEVEVAGLFDLQRLASQVLIPHTLGKELQYRRYDWESGVLGDWVRNDSQGPLIVEGIYSTHRTLRDFYDLRVWVTAPRAVRLARGIQRDGEEARRRWVDVWMPAEDRYTTDQAPQDHAHLVLDGTGAMAEQGDEVSFAVTGGLLSEGP